MKKVMFALCFMFGGVVVVNAQQDQQDTTSNQYRTEEQSQYPQDMQSQDQNRERIQATELPDEVKRTLEGEEYRGWLISGAFKSTGSADQTGMESDTTSTGTPTDPSINATGVEGEEIYIVELKNGAETKTLRFDSNGQKLEGMDDENSQNSQFNQQEQMNQDQMNQRDQMNQNDQMDQQTPNDQSLETDPNATEQPGQSQTPGDQQSTDQATQPQPDQSTETQPQPDQSRANEPK